MTFNIPFKVKLKTTKHFDRVFKKAIEKSTKYVTKSIRSEINSDSGRTASQLDYSINFRKGESTIGWKKNSKDELVGNVLQFGSGEKGSVYTTSKFGESKPKYTIPIVPKYAKAMSFIGRDGQRKYMKTFVGHPPQHIITKGTIKAMRFVPNIFYNEFNK